TLVSPDRTRSHAFGFHPRFAILRRGVGWAKARLRAGPTRLSAHADSPVGTLRFADPTRWNLKPSSRLKMLSIPRIRPRSSCRGELGRAAGFKGGTVMRQKIGYCRQKAAECAARAQDATDKETRELFLRFRDSWLSAARRYESSAAAAAGETTERPPPSFAPTPSARDWRESRNDARTDTTAERLGAGWSAGRGANSTCRAQ